MSCCKQAFEVQVLQCASLMLGSLPEAHERRIKVIIAYPRKNVQASPSGKP